MPNNYDDVVERNKKYLTQAQIAALAKAAQEYGNMNAGNRAGALASVREQFAAGQRGLQNMGLAGGLEGPAASGELPRLSANIQTPFEQYNRKLMEVENKQLSVLGTSFAESTKKARVEAARKKAEAEAAAAEWAKRKQREYVPEDPRMANMLNGDKRVFFDKQNAQRSAAIAAAELDPRTAAWGNMRSDLAAYTSQRQDAMAAERAAATAAASLYHIDPRMSYHQERGSDRAAYNSQRQAAMDPMRQYWDTKNDVSEIDHDKAGKELIVAQKEYNSSLTRHRSGQLTDQELGQAKQNLAMAELKYRDPDTYKAIKLFPYLSQIKSEDPELAKSVIEKTADYNLQTYGIKTPGMTDEEYEAGKAKIKGVRDALKAVDNAQIAYNNAGEAEPEDVVSDKEHAAAALDAAKRYLKDTYNMTVEEARSYEDAFNRERDARSEYNYYRTGMLAQIEHSGERPAQPLNQQETDDLYRLINWMPLIAQPGTDKYSASIDISAYNYMTDEQRDVYNAIYERDGLDAANKFYESIIPFLNIQRAMADEEYYKQYAKEHKFLADLRSIGANLVWNVPASVENLVTGIVGRFSEERPYYDPQSSVSYRSARADIIRTERSEEILSNMNRPEWANQALNLAYNTTMSIGDSAAVMALSYLGAPPAVTSVVFGSSAGNQAYKDAIARGATQDQALSYGILNGVAEALFEEVSLEKVMSMDFTGRRAFIKNLLSQSFVEGSEEFATGVADMLADLWVMQDKSKYSLAKKEYMSQGMTEYQAERRAFLEQAKEISMDTLGGFISGAAFAGGGKVLSSAQYKAYGKSLRNDSATLDRYTRAAALLGGNAIDALEEYKANPSDVNAGKLKAAVDATFIEIFGDEETGKLNVPDVSNASSVDSARPNPLRTDAALDVDAAKNERVFNRATAGAALLSGERMNTTLAKTVIDVLGTEYLRSQGYDVSSPQAFTNDYNSRLDKYGIKPYGTAQTTVTPKLSAQSDYRTRKAAKPFQAESPSSEGGVITGKALQQRQQNRQQVGLKAMENSAAARVWKNPSQGYVTTADGRQVMSLPGNLTAVPYEEQQKNNFAARTTAKAGRTAYQIAGMEALPGLTDEQKITAIKKNMNRAQLARAEFIETLSDALHVNMVIHDDMNSANGYVDNDGTIHFSLSSKQSVLRVASHELAHKIREVSEEHFNAIKDAIIKQVGADTFNKKVEQKKEEYRKAGVKLDQDLAIEETVAEYSEKMLQNTDFLEDFVEENPEAAKTLKGELLKILNAVKRAFKRAENRNYGGSWANDIKYTKETLQAMYDGLEAVMRDAQNPEKTARKAETQAESVQEKTAAEADELYMSEEDRQAEQAKKEALESAKKKTHVPGYKSSEVESVISAGIYGDKANYEGSDYETARGMIAQTIPEVTAALEGEADAMDAYDKVRAAVGAMLDNYFEDEGDMTGLREAIPAVIGVDQTAKGDLKYSDQSLFQMSAKLSKALGKRVTLVGETNAKGQKNASYKTAEKLDEVWERVRDQFGLSDDQNFSIDTTKLLDFIEQQADTRKSFGDLYGSQRQEIVEYQSMAIMDAVQDMYEQKTGKKFSMDTDTLRQSMQKHNISAEIISAVETVQELNRKSVNTFSSEEIKKTEPFAREWYAQMKEKSPFFRAWFGEWRAHDKTPVVKVTADTKKEYKSGKIKNLDANRLISWGLQVKGETKIKYGPGSYAFDYLGNIEEIAKNAVLFETKTSKPDANSKMDYTAFMHSFYAVVENKNGYVSVVKLLAEEAISKKGIDFTRAYELQEIREVAVLHPSVLSAGSSKGLTRQSATIENVSDLYEYVKTNDKSLKPGREVDPAFLNDDGTPKVFYHGTDATFDAFDRTKGRANMDIQGMFFSPYEIEAEGYGSNVGQYYLSIHNPASEDVAYKALNMFKGQNNAGVKAREYLESKGYDGVVGYDEVIAFQPAQIKSATDNIGTFNKYDERYRYSVDTDAIRDAFTVIDTEGIEDGLEALKGVTPGKGLWALKDISRFLDSVSGGDKNLRNTLHAIFEAPHSDATGRYARNVARMQQKVLDIASRAGVCDENGKHFDSKKSAAIQNIGEGFSNTYTNLKYKVLDAEHVTVQAYDPDTKKLVVSEKDYTLDELRHDYGSNVADYVWDQAYRQAENAQAAGGEKAWQEQLVNTRPYTLADLQKAFPNDWQKLERAANEFRQMYDDYIRDQNNMLATIYPIESEYESVDKLTEGIEAKEQRLEKMRAETERRVAKLEERIEAKKTASENRVAELEKKLTAKEKEMAGKRRTNTKAFRDLQDQAFRIRTDIENEKADIAEYQAGVNAKIGAIRDQFKEYEKNAKDELKKMNQAKAETENAISHGEGDSLKRMHRLQYRSDYFHHFTEMASGIQNLKAIFKDNTDISPAIVGKSGNTRAKTKWAGYYQERIGSDYTADAINGMLRYGQLAEYKLAFDPLTAYLRDVTKQIRAIDDETNRDNMIRYLDEWTNAIMGKSHTLDRAIIDSGLGMRSKMFKTLDWINSRVIQNTLLFNMRSALIQGSNLTNAKGIVRNNMDWANGLRCWALAAKGDEAMASIMAQSNFLASRYMDNLQLTDNKLKKAKEFAGWMLGALDEVSAKATWWAAYTQYTRNPNAKSIQGMGRTYESAVDYADDVTRRTHAGRGVGELAPAMTSRVINLVAPFQVEVNNTWQLLKDNVKQRNYLGLLSTGLSVFLFNTFFEAIIGSTPLGFDFIRAIVDICFGLAGDDSDDDDDNYGVKEIGQRLAGELVGGLPFAGSVVKFVGQDYAKEILGDNTDVTRYDNTQIGLGAIMNAGRGIKDIGKAIIDKRNPLTSTNFIADIDDLLNIIMPMGGKQLTRTAEGIKTVAQGYGSKIDNKGEEQVQFMTGQNILDYLHAGLFGKWALTEASEYFGEKRLLPWVFGAYNGPKASIGKPVDAKEYKAALQTGIDGRQYFSLKYDLRIYTKQEAKRAEMMEQPFTTEQKAQLDALLIPTAEAKAKGAVVYQKTSDGEWAVKADYTSKEWMDVAELGDKKYNQAKESGINPKTFLEICEKWKGMSGKDKKQQAQAYLDSLPLTENQYDYIWMQVFNYKSR